VGKEEFNMANVITYDKLMFAKLFAAGLLLNSAKTKIDVYMKKQEDIISQVIEDENSFEMLYAYYVEQSEELLKFAEGSQYTSEEAEKEFYASLGEHDDNNKDT
jgi:hypothetical protein